MNTGRAIAAIAALVLPFFAAQSQAAELKVYNSTALKTVLEELGPQFEKATENKLATTVGPTAVLKAQIEGGAAFDVVIVSPAAIGGLAKGGKVVADSRTDLAKVGVGVVVKEGAPRPDISSVEAFRRALIAAKSVAYIDPASGGSSGIFVDQLLDKLGIGAEVKAKAKLIPGGAVADHIANGEADIGIHQISEILPVKGVTLVGPLPTEIQNYTVYAAGISADSKHVDAAKALIMLLSGPSGAAIFQSKGMEPTGT